MMSEYQRQIFEETVLQRLTAIEAKLAELDSRTVGLIRLGPTARNQKEIAETVARIRDAIAEKTAKDMEIGD